MNEIEKLKKSFDTILRDVQYYRQRCDWEALRQATSELNKVAYNLSMMTDQG